MLRKFLFAIFIILIYSSKLFSQKEDDLLFKNSDDSTQQNYIDYINKNAPHDKAYIALQRLIAPYLKESNFDAAVEWIVEFKGLFPNIQVKLDKLIEILQRVEQPLIEINLGELINTNHTEQSPLPMADESKMYYTFRQKVGEKYEDDIYESEKIDDVWQKGVSLGPPVNTPESAEAPQGLSTDGQTLILFGNYRGSFGNGDLFESHKLPNNKWSKVQHFPKPINSEYFDCDGKLTNDGKYLIFVSDRPNPYSDLHQINEDYLGSKFGNTDIWVAERINDTTWGEPINLGPMINTPYAERKPFLHPDGRTLYFSSNGHVGLGRLDLYKSIKLSEDSWSEWSEPIHMGRYINGPDNDWGSIVATDGEKAFFAGNGRTGNYGSSDLFSITIPEYAKPYGVAIINGFVKDESGKAIEANIIWEDLNKNKKLGNLKSDPDDGSYVMVLPVGKNYGFYAQKEGYFPSSKFLDLRKVNKFMRDTAEIILYSLENIEKGNIRLNNLFFDYNKDNLLDQSIPELNRLIDILNSVKDLAVEIQGHTDDRGSEKFNQNLSEKRAKSVYDYLVNTGKISPERLSSVGYGKLKPVVPNDSDSNRQRNRRVEIKFTRVKK
jgi:outer membrane protein OmpA-like peptidoglycan-associated protein